METLIPAPAPRTGAASLAMTEGLAWPMGAHVDDTGVNFAVFSAHAQAVDLCLFDSAGAFEVARLRLPGHTGDVWHGHLAGADDDE